MGDLSTAGTTASTVIFRQNHIYVANVGDSTAILALVNPEADEAGQHPVIAKVLTKDHKPEDPDESRLIEKLGMSYGFEHAQTCPVYMNMYIGSLHNSEVNCLCKFLLATVFTIVANTLSLYSSASISFSDQCPCG